MTNLTEQWKKGELPIGWYYTKLWKGCNVIDYFIGNQFLRYDDSDIVEVIAPVPSYDEWKHITDCFDYEHNAIIEFQRQIRQFQDLLIRSQEFIDAFEDDTDPAGFRARQLNKEIGEVLK